MIVRSKRLDLLPLGQRVETNRPDGSHSVRVSCALPAAGMRDLLLLDVGGGLIVHGRGDGHRST